MQVCTVSVNLAGNQNSQVIGKVVTVPEIQLLQHIHGKDAVFDIVPVDETNRVPQEEIERLQQTYGPDKFAAVFTGAFPKLPQTLAEIGMDVEEQATNLEAKAKKMLEDVQRLRGKAPALKTVDAPKTLNDIFGDDEKAAA